MRRGQRSEGDEFMSHSEIYAGLDKRVGSETPVGQCFFAEHGRYQDTSATSTVYPELHFNPTNIFGAKKIA
jgi:hypothetical protein